MTGTERIVTLIAIYLVGLFLTFGHVYNNHECIYPDQKAYCAQNRETGSIFSGMFWPLYWASRAGIEVTK
jgi:hypothetical protein